MPLQGTFSAPLSCRERIKHLEKRGETILEVEKEPVILMERAVVWGKVIVWEKNLRLRAKGIINRHLPHKQAPQPHPETARLARLNLT